MAYNTVAIRTDVNNKPIPQYYNPVTGLYEALLGANGASRHILYGADGNPVSTTGGKLDIRASEIETALTSILEKVTSAPDVSTAPPTLYNLSLAVANTEYSLEFTGAKKIIVSIRDGDNVDNFRLAFASGKVATPTAPYLEYPQNVEYWVDLVNIANGTIYLASSVAGKVAQIQIWQ